MSPVISATAPNRESSIPAISANFNWGTVKTIVKTITLIAAGVFAALAAAAFFGPPGMFVVSMFAAGAIAMLGVSFGVDYLFPQSDTEENAEPGETPKGAKTNPTGTDDEDPLVLKKGGKTGNGIKDQIAQLQADNEALRRRLADIESGKCEPKKESPGFFDRVFRWISKGFEKVVIQAVAAAIVGAGIFIVQTLMVASRARG